MATPFILLMLAGVIVVLVVAAIAAKRTRAPLAAVLYFVVAVFRGWDSSASFRSNIRLWPTTSNIWRGSA